MEELEPAPPIDWAAVLGKLREKKKAQTAPDAASEDGMPAGAKEEPSKEPKLSATKRKNLVPTPVRPAELKVPAFVLQGLDAKPAPAPFATAGGAEDLAEAAAPDDKDEEMLAATGASKRKRKSKKKKSKAVRALSAADEAALEPPLDKNPAAAKAAPVGDESVKYVAGEFNKHRLRFIKEKQAEGLKFRAASDAWMLSNERAALLVGVSDSEMKKRRFQ